jgi:glycosyltransferase involved in cell wall biosynthesis
MKIAYLGQMADISHENGISKKILLQATHWQEKGCRVRYFAMPSSTAVWEGMAHLEHCLIARGGSLNRVANSLQLCSLIREWRPDIIYFRYCYHSPGFPSLFRTTPCVAEMNSQDLSEYANTLPRLKRLYHRFTRVRVLSSVQAFVPVTHEIGRFYSGFSKPQCVIGNSINIESFHPLPPSVERRESLVFVGTPGAPWHGLDRIGELARMFPMRPVDLVGATPEDWDRQTGGAERPHNLRFHGMLPRSQYEAIMTKAVVAVGSMALYKNSMNEACPLKVREYLSMGLPVIAAYKDTDIPDDADYFLRLPNDDAPITSWRERIAAFLARWAGRRVPRSCIAHLDVSVKEKVRLDFMAKVLASPTPK